jgi:hypothetical protein
MTANDVLDRIANNLSERKASAALSNYKVLCNNIGHLNRLLSDCLAQFVAIRRDIDALLGNSSALQGDFGSGQPKFPFVKIVPRILANGTAIIEKFTIETQPDDRSGISLETVALLKRDFLDYSSLATATRQTVDSLVSDSYQLHLLDPLELNFHVLVSLNSFDKFVTPSIRNALFTDDLVDTLAELRKLPFKQWKQSPITSCQQQTFAQKIDFLLSQIPSHKPPELSDTLKDIFKFTSEFTHIGYVSTFYSSSSESEIIFGDEHGPYLPSTENFSELKYEMLLVGCRLFSEVYLISVAKAITQIAGSNNSKEILEKLTLISDSLREGINTRNNKYFFFIKSGLTKKQEPIVLTCMCEHANTWEPPFQASDLFCKGCGSSFTLIELEGDSGYVFTSTGPVKIIGANVPDFCDLPTEEQEKMLRQMQEMSEQQKKG